MTTNEQAEAQRVQLQRAIRQLLEEAIVNEDTLLTKHPALRARVEDQTMTVVEEDGELLVDGLRDSLLVIKVELA